MLWGAGSPSGRDLEDEICLLWEELRPEPPRPKADCQVCFCSGLAVTMQCRRTCLLLGALPSLGRRPNELPCSRCAMASEKEPAQHNAKVDQPSSA